MNIKKTLKILFFVILFLAVAGYLVFVFFGMKSANPEEECVGVAVIMDNQEDAFVDSMAVINILQDNGIKPEGKKMKDINMQLIKNTLEKNPFILSAECYQSNNGMDVGTGMLCIKVTEVAPVMLVFDDKSSYYVDAQGKIIKSDIIYPKNILVANGDITKNYLIELAQLAQYIKNDELWDNQIEQIFVSMNGMKEREITLIPRVGNQKILLGTIDMYDKKLIRLKKFYERGINKIGWNKYSALNLKYKNLVVGIIKGQEVVIANNADKPETNQEGQQQNPDQNTQTNTQQPNNQNAEQPKAEQPKPNAEQPKAEQPTTEQPKTEQPKQETPKTEQNKQ